MQARLRLLFATLVVGISTAGPAVAQSVPQVTSEGILSSATVVSSQVVSSQVVSPQVSPTALPSVSLMPANSMRETLSLTSTAQRPESIQRSMSQESSPAVNNAEPVGPRVEQTRAGVQAQTVLPESAPAPALMPPRAGKPVALMIVGAAAVVTGLIIGDDEGAFIAIGGLAVGLYGLYNYVK